MRIKCFSILSFDAIIQESPLTGKEKDYPLKKKARDFIVEFAKNKKGRRAFFLHYFIDKYFQDIKKDYKSEFDLLVKELGYSKDFCSIFLNAAKEFPEKIREESVKFIEWLYEDLSKDHPEYDSRENLQFFLENFFGCMKIEGAAFSEVIDELFSI